MIIKRRKGKKNRERAEEIKRQKKKTEGRELSAMSVMLPAARRESRHILFLFVSSKAQKVHL